jgi:Tol biopolymer transport system component
LTLAATVWGFGKNKVEYEKYSWRYLKTPHFDVYFHQNQGLLPEICAKWIENDFDALSDEFNYKFKGRIPLILYGSPNTFEQTNIIPDILPEGVGGFTTQIKNRIVIPFDGSYEELRHVLHHELVHGFQYNILYGKTGGILSYATEMSMPLWLAEGMAEYLSCGWNSEADMFLMDATIFGDIQTPGPNLDGYRAYKGGQSFLYYLASLHGDSLSLNFMKRIKNFGNFDHELKKEYGKSLKDLGDDWLYQLKRIYWPEIGGRITPEKTGKAITSHVKEKNFFNLRPRISPDGRKVAYFSDRNDYTQIIIADGKGKILQTISQSGFAGNFESFHPFRSGMCWSPTGKRIAFITLSAGKDELRIIDIGNKKLIRSFCSQLSSIYSPDWSPDGKSIAFCGVDKEHCDLYQYFIASGKLKRLTNTMAVESDPRFSRDSKTIIFGAQDSSGAPLRQGKPSNRAPVDLFSINPETGETTQLTHGYWNKKSPCFSPDGSSVLYVSDKNGIDNLYIAPLSAPDSCRPLTDVIGGCGNPDWAKDSNVIVYCLFQKGGWDIWNIKDPDKKLSDRDLVPTKWAKSLADTSVSYFEPRPEWENDRRLFVDSLDKKNKTKTKNRKPGAVILSSIDDENFIAEEDTTSKQPVDSATSKSDTAKKLPERKTDKTEKTDSLKDSLSAPAVMNFDTLNTSPYGIKFSPDALIVGAGVNPYYGSGYSGQWLAVFSDLLGNHQITLAGDVDGNFADYTHIYGSYMNLQYKVNFGAGLFFNREYTSANLYSDSLFFDTEAGAILMSSLPFSMFSRLELNIFYQNLKREPYIYDDSLYNDNGKTTKTYNIIMPSIAFVHDDILWGITGPLNGTRYQAEITLSPPVKGINESFLSFDADFRKYLHLWKRFVWANKIAFGASVPINGEPASARKFFMGGDENWLNYSINTEGYKANMNNFFYSQIVVPFRGWSYLDLTGSKFAVFNTEFRFPFIKEFSIAWPLPVTMRYVNGAVFVDAGNAWDNKDEFKNIPLPEHIYGGTGYGLRANLGIFVLRYDRAWKTDWNTYLKNPVSYWSLGAEF